MTSLNFVLVELLRQAALKTLVLQSGRGLRRTFRSIKGPNLMPDRFSELLDMRSPLAASPACTKNGTIFPNERIAPQGVGASSKNNRHTLERPLMSEPVRTN